MTEYLESVQGFVSEMSRPTTITQIVSAMVRSNKAQFDREADIAADARPKELHHVYEWGETGTPRGRLWDFVVEGRGGQRELFYVFRASKRPVPTTNLPGDTRNRVHIFHWKAPVMEQGDPLTVFPSSDKGILVFPRGQHGGGFATLNSDMEFTRNPVKVQHPGGLSRGKFGHLWETYWATWGNRIIVEDIINPTNVFLATKFPELIRTISKSRVSHVAGIHINTAPRQNMYPRAERMVEDMVSGYLAAARQREAIAGVAENSNI